MKNKVILDEMQQKTLLEIEHKTLHIALTGLLIVILMQQIFWKDGQNTLGEAAVLLISSVQYMHPSSSPFSLLC